MTTDNAALKESKLVDGHRQGCPALPGYGHAPEFDIGREFDSATALRHIDRLLALVTEQREQLAASAAFSARQDADYKQLLEEHDELTAQLAEQRERIAQLEAERDKWKERALRFQEAYKEKDFEAFALDLQKLDLLANGADKVTQRQNASLRTELMKVARERNAAKAEVETLHEQKRELVVRLDQTEAILKQETHQLEAAQKEITEWHQAKKEAVEP